MLFTWLSFCGQNVGCRRGLTVTSWAAVEETGTDVASIAGLSAFARLAVTRLRGMGGAPGRPVGPIPASRPISELFAPAAIATPEHDSDRPSSSRAPFFAIRA